MKIDFPGVPNLHSAQARAPVLVLGIGNILLQDEGLGVRAVEAILNRYDIPPGIELLDGGTAGMSLMEFMAGREQLIIVDAVQTGEPPGSLVSMREDDVPAYFHTHITPHDIGLADVLATLHLTGETPDHILLLGLVPEALELSLELSQTVTDKLDALIDSVVAELRLLGYRLYTKQQSLGK